MNSDGTNVRRLTHTAADDVGQEWSPNGRRIAFVRQGAGGRSDLYVMNADGSGQRLLVQHAREHFWSPDGRQIAFGAYRDRNWELYVMNADGSGQRRLTHTRARNEGHTRWSPAQKQ